MRIIPLVLVSVLIGCGPQLAERASKRGKACYERQDFGCAVAQFGIAVREEPDSLEYRYNLGLALARARAFKQSETELQEVLRKDPGNINARKALATVQATLAWEQTNYR